MKYDNNWVKEITINTEEIEFIFFWGHQPKKNGTIHKSCFSQWFEREFKHEGVVYQTAEHWMMAEKARLFNDTLVLEKILKTKSSHEVKKLGREVSGFDEKLWEKHRFDIVKKGNYLKFKQNSDLLSFLLSTGDSVIVEASPYDKIWGIGMKNGEEGIENPINWKGINLLGYALMEVRDLLKEELEKN